jgi:hypothetical protein
MEPLNNGWAMSSPSSLEVLRHRPPGRSPGSRIFAAAAPSQAKAQWHDRPRSPFTVAGQLRIRTGFPLGPETGATLRLFSSILPLKIFVKSKTDNFEKIFFNI